MVVSIISPKTRRWLARLCARNSSPVLVAGARRSQRSEQNLKLVHELLDDFDSLPFDDRAADHAGRIRAELDSEGRPIGANDLLIAAIALANNLVLVTHNTREFSRVAGLKLEDWQLA